MSLDFLQLFSDYTLRNVALGSAVLGVTGGVIGSFTMLRRQSLLGDALSHAALPGVALAFLLTSSKASLWLLLGAGLTAWLAAMLMLAAVRYTRLSEDAALGTVLASFFGVGLVLLTYIQKVGGAGQAGLDKFLFGQAATIVHSDIFLMVILAAVALGTIALLFKEFKLISFDPDFAATIGLPTKALATLLTSLAVVAVMVGLQTVGVVLMASMLIAPPAAARQWTDNLSQMLLLSAVFGALSGIGGALLSASGPNLPTGPFVIVIATLILLISLGFAPRRGILWNALRRRRQAHAFRAEILAQESQGVG